MNWRVFFLTAANDPNTIESSYRLSLWNYGVFLRRLTGGTFTGPLLAILAAGLVLSRRFLAVLAAAVLGVLFPVLVFAIPQHGEWRYVQPLMPGVAFAAAWCVANARWAPARLVLAMALLAATMHAHFAFFSYEARREHDVSEQLVGARPEADLIARAVLSQTAGPRAGKIGLAVHPLWRDPHLTCEYLQYALIRRDELQRFDVSCFAWSDYLHFREELRAGRYDVLLMECGARGDCGEEGSRLLADRAALMESRGYVDQITGQRQGAYTRKDVDDDLAWIRAEYRRALLLPMNDGTYPGVWIRNRSRDEADGRANRQP